MWALVEGLSVIFCFFRLSLGFRIVGVCQISSDGNYVHWQWELCFRNFQSTDREDDGVASLLLALNKLDAGERGRKVANFLGQLPAL